MAGPTDILGWYRTASAAWVLEDIVTQGVTNLREYTLRDSNGPWSPQAGDVFTDANGLSDTVMAVQSATVFFGIVGPVGWADGFVTIVRRAPTERAHSVNFRGTVKALDNALLRTTDVALRGGNVIAASIGANVTSFAPPGFDYASVIEVTPATYLLEIQSAHWYAPQEIKILINVDADNDFAVVHNHGGVEPREAIITNTGANIQVRPGESVALIRDTQGVNNRWRAARNSLVSAAPDNVVYGPDRVVYGPDLVTY